MPVVLLVGQTWALAPGVLASALDAIGSQLHVFAWAGSVAGLAHPSVSLRHHARSLMPGSALGGAPIREVPATLYGEQWWGTSGPVEAVGVPSSLQ
ncbi:MAG: hypothetical protein ACR2NR_17750 [Solirubrobacteraceae bacterium]